MSWDVILMDVAPEIRSINDLGDGFDSVLGPVDDVRRLIARTIPNIDLSDPTWGILEGPDYSIEFSIGEQEPCNSVMLHVRGTEVALEPIRAICSAAGWKAFDCSDGELMDWSGDPGKGLRAWREYRGQLMLGQPEGGVALPLPDGRRVFFDIAPTPAKRRARPWWKFWA